MNIQNYASSWELHIVAAIGIVLQTSVLVYAHYSAHNSSLRGLLGTPPQILRAWYFTLIGTLSVVLGMFGCSSIIDHSTREERYCVKDGEAHILWLQKGKSVNDQVFYSYAVFAKGKRRVIMTSRRNDQITDPDHVESRAKFFGFLTTAASLLSLVGFVVQFMGLRAMHWSVPVAQMLATIIMTVLRAFVRRGLSKCPYSQPLPPGHEIDWLATRITEELHRSYLWKKPDQVQPNTWSRSIRNLVGWGHPTAIGPPRGFWSRGCLQWSVVTPNDMNGYEPLRHYDPQRASGRAQDVMEARKRLGVLTRWPSPYSTNATSVSTAIELVMNTLNLIQFVPGEEVFTWSMFTGGSQNITFKLQHQASGRWEVDLHEIEAALSLWIFSSLDVERGTTTDDEGNEIDQHQNIDGGDEKTPWLRRGTTPRKLGVRLLGPSSPSSRRDMRWWMGEGVRKVVEVDLSGESFNRIDSPEMITLGDHRTVGFAGQRVDPGEYRSRSLLETLAGDQLIESMVAMAPTKSRTTPSN